MEEIVSSAVVQETAKFYLLWFRNMRRKRNQMPSETWRG